MCNAWNHPPQCTCGWGGLGHLGKRTTGNESWIKFLGFTGISSYTIPNARCPVCGDAVFFYQSPNGGRVFFDELGPPWPKHGCTDNSNRPLPYLFPLSFVQAANKTYSWQQSDWEPFIVDKVVLQPQLFKISNIRGRAGENELSLYVKSKLELRAPYFVRLLERDRGLYEISTLITEQFSKVIHPKLFKGYTSIIELEKKVVYIGAPKPKVKKKKVKKLEPTNSANKTNKTDSVIKNQKPKPTTLTAIQIAFQTAKIKKTEFKNKG